MVEADKKRQIVETCLNNGVIVNRTMLEQLNAVTDLDGFYSHFMQYSGNKDRLKEFSSILEEYNDRTDISSSADKGAKISNREIISRDQPSVDPTPSNTLQTIENKGTAKEPPTVLSGTVSVTFSYNEEPRKREVQDFTNYFISRYNTISKILQTRKEMHNLTSINRIGQKRERGEVAIIGLVSEKMEGRTGKIIFTVEDLTGTIKVMVSPNSPSYELAKETMLDEILGFVGMGSEGIIFANSVLVPDIPIYKELKKSPDEAYALFIGDFHFGSNLFIRESFNKLISWIRGEYGNDTQKEISRKVKYIFLLGDLVEGVGIYPNQENDLEIKDIFEQYTKFADELSKIPKDKHLIICPGNHDAMRIAEPQPPLYKDFAEAVWKLPNVTMVSNPAYVNIHKSDKFPGFDVLMYHGFSFTYYADAVESIRSAGGQARSDLIMKYVLQRRHLAPTHKSTLYLPDPHKDSLVIDKIPDIFATGHIHRVAAASYRNVTLLNCSCWLEKSDYQEKLGIEPDPGRAILVNLQNRQVKIMKFYDGKKAKSDEDE